MKDLTGMRFHRLLVIERVNGTRKNRAKWRCRCDCGKEVFARTERLLNGTSKSCRCHLAVDMSGQRIGRLTVLGRAPRLRPRDPAAWLCRCDCGNEVVLFGCNLRGGCVSCGCFASEASSARMRETFTTHGLSRHPLYLTWVSIRHRTGNPRDKDFRRYGARGISVCPSWRDSVDAFIAGIESEIGEKPLGPTEFTLDRINNDGNYEPGNVRWATRAEQARNRRPHRKRSAA